MKGGLRDGRWCWREPRLDIKFASVGEVELKGFDHPVEAFEVPWKPITDTALPRPAQLVRDRTGAFVGRDYEQQLLAAHVQ